MNALDTVRLIREAEGTALRWQATYPALWDAVRRTIPAHLERRYTPMEWGTTVALFMQDAETPTTAAERLAKYLVLHQERHDQTPTLASIQRHAADRIRRG